jgi:hypothetical protein
MRKLPERAVNPPSGLPKTSLSFAITRLLEWSLRDHDVAQVQENKLFWVAPGMTMT